MFMYTIRFVYSSTYCALVTLYGKMDLRQLWLSYWLVAWRHLTTTWTNVDFFSVRFCGIHLRNFTASAEATVLYD